MIYTPIVPCICEASDNHIFIKRDDLLPFSFGGNKVRIAEELISDMLEQGKNCMIGYGSTKSNLCRVLANMCSSKGIKCHIISSEDDNGELEKTNNSRLVNVCGAVVHLCSKNNVAETVISVTEQCKEEGYNPYYIYGNEYGIGNEAVPVRAYVKAHSELPYDFDYIFLATGTGMTQAGLIAGKRKNKTKEKIIGISVARNSEQETKIIEKYLSAYFNSEKITDTTKDICILDSYLCGGYGKYSDEIIDVIKQMFTQNGIPLDTTYTGKAFWGMLSYLKENNIKNKKVLFIHTGGTPLFFDKIEEYEQQCITYQMLLEYVRALDKELPTPLSERVSLEEYTSKIYCKAHTEAIVVDGKIISAAIGYTENLTDNLSYITLLGTLPCGQNKGYAGKVLSRYIEYCVSKNIDGIHLHTEKNNIAARNFYKKYGFVDFQESENTDKSHLILWLDKEKQ